MKNQFSNAVKACLTVLMLIFASSAFSQDMARLKSKTPEERARFQSVFMQGKLNLNEEQTTKVQVINLKYANKMDVLMKDDGGKFAKFKKIKQVQKDKDEDLKGVLTADQFKQYQVIEEEMKEKVKEGMKNRKQ